MKDLRKHVLSWSQLFWSFIKKIPFFSFIFNYLSSILSCLSRLCVGNFIAPGALQSVRPNKPLIMYEFEACPFCRLARETLSTLSLDVIIYPCPRETLTQYGHMKDSRFRPIVKELGGKLMFPFLVDQNTNNSLYESKDIQAYLWKYYGTNAQKPFNYKLAMSQFFFMLGTTLHAILRPLPEMGLLRTPSIKPDKMLELWSREHLPSAKIVREALCTLEIPYLLHNNLTKENTNIPTLLDPNKGIEITGSKKITQYLFETYQAGSTTSESFLEYGSKDQKN
jgi:hypothetical protein